MYNVWLSFKETINCKSSKSMTNVHQPKKFFKDWNHIVERKDSMRKLFLSIDNLISSENRTPEKRFHVSFKDTSKCCSTGKSITDVHQSKKIFKDRSNIVERENSVIELYLPSESPMENLLSWKNSTRERFHELNIGHPSRDVIEMIFRNASMSPSKHMENIAKVLKVKNSIETLGRFEVYREMVKKKAHSQYTKHQRSIVDGNELLQFYKTTISCCLQKLDKVSELCQNPRCGVCRIIQSGFNTEDTKKNGIRLSSRSETLSDDRIGITAKGENVKRAVVVCRVIAGAVVNMVGEGFDSVGIEALHSKVEQLFVRNPDAVLPCFVIVCA